MTFLEAHAWFWSMLRRVVMSLRSRWRSKADGFDRADHGVVVASLAVLMGRFVVGSSSMRPLLMVFRVGDSVASSLALVNVRTAIRASSRGAAELMIGLEGSAVTSLAFGVERVVTSASFFRSSLLLIGVDNPV